MAVVTTIDNAYQLERLFNECGRKEHFSYYGYQGFYDYLEQYSEDCGQDFHIDVVALCCDFTEYKDWEEIYFNYSYSYNGEGKDFETLEEDNELDDFIQWVEDRTQVIYCNDYKGDLQSIILKCF